MKRLIALVLVLMISFSAFAAVSESGKDAYELGRAVVGILTYNEAEGRNRNTQDVLASAVENLRADWDKPHYDRYIGILDGAGLINREDYTGPWPRGVLSRPDVEEVARDGYILMADMKITNASWLHAKAVDYDIIYSSNGELEEYSIDGDIYFFLYMDSSNANIRVEGEDLRIGERDLKNPLLELAVDLVTLESTVKYNGMKLQGDDVAALMPVVQAAAEFF